MPAFNLVQPSVGSSQLSLGQGRAGLSVHLEKLVRLGQVGNEDGLAFRDGPVARHEFAVLPHRVNLMQSEVVLVTRKSSGESSCRKRREQGIFDTHGVEVPRRERSAILEDLVQALLDSR